MRRIRKGVASIIDEKWQRGGFWGDRGGVGGEGGGGGEGEGDERIEG